ncbi:hypothetical protein DICVIV_03641 [Dictyocaulus viviparus]|uniref:WD domain, G-beta repeat protein n=1 Tax=Dictyocaulus viviparus TaxID=29172 RepID=A0A0D8Y230_DICVI|nr:hypothetical protein DICVIV_03641 [Dictyocaulus viviparus]
MISCWDVRSNRTALSSIVIRQKKAIKGLRLSSDGKHLIVVLHTGTVILCDAITMEVLAQYETKHPKKSNYEMSHAFGHVALCDEGSSIRVALPLGDNVEWISFSKGYRQEPRFLYSSTLIAHLSMVNACVYRNGSQQLYTAGSDNNVICWAPESEKNRLKLDAETVKKSLFMNDWSDDD